MEVEGGEEGGITVTTTQQVNKENNGAVVTLLRCSSQAGLSRGLHVCLLGFLFFFLLNFHFHVILEIKDVQITRHSSASLA